jgi:hypothetical protein
MPFNNPIVKNSPTFAKLLKRTLKSEQDKKAYLDELTRPDLFSRPYSNKEVNIRQTRSA